MSELLNAAASEVGLKYWAFKGFADPRDPSVTASQRPAKALA